MIKSKIAIAVFAVMAAASAAGAVDFDGKTGAAEGLNVPELKAAVSGAPLRTEPAAAPAQRQAGADALKYLYIEGRGFSVSADLQAGAFEKARPASLFGRDSSGDTIKAAVLRKMSDDSREGFLQSAAKIRQAKPATRYDFGDCWEGETSVQQLSGGELLICKLVCCLASPDNMHSPTPGTPTCEQYCERQ